MTDSKNMASKSIYPDLYKTRLIAEAKIKTDKVDKTLARLLRADMLHTCYVPDDEQRRRRELLRHWLRLVKTRTKVKNWIHNILDKHGLRMRAGRLNTS